MTLSLLDFKNEAAIISKNEKVSGRIKAYVVLKEDIKGITGYELIKWCRVPKASRFLPFQLSALSAPPKHGGSESFHMNLASIEFAAPVK